MEHLEELLGPVNWKDEALKNNDNAVFWFKVAIASLALSVFQTGVIIYLSW